MKVVVAMSGGVDSSVAAAILTQQGYQVIGIRMQILPLDNQTSQPDNFGGFCKAGAIDDAKKVASKLGIQHHVMNVSEIFYQEVITNFCQEYSLGRTPNPCIRCNRFIKFGVLLEKARYLGADFIASGHHARIERDEVKGRYLLKKGADQGKDQSYFLYALTQEQLKHTLFPIGHLTKQKVFEIARELELPVAAKPESQDICFIPDNNYPGFLKQFIPQALKPGPILNEQGSTIGEHQGILFYTIGQRKGLGISAKKPLYVIAIDQERNAIVVGGKQAAYKNECIASGLNWITIDQLEQAGTVYAKIRYHHKEAEATIAPIDEDKVYVTFSQPQIAITPGQAIVFYDGDYVVGGGTIEQVRK